MGSLWLLEGDRYEVESTVAVPIVPLEAGAQGCQSELSDSFLRVFLRSSSVRRRISRRGWALALAGSGRASAVETRREVEPTEALGVGEYIDLDDLPAPDREAHHR